MSNCNERETAKKYMGDLAPKRLIVDNKRHLYTVSIDGQLKKASYIAIHNPFGESGPSLLCSYGLLDEAQEHTYSSLTQ